MHTRLSHFIFPFFLFISVTLFSSYFALHHVDPHHDGILLKPALDVAQGKIAFKETFNQYGALTVFLQAFLLKVFGFSLVYLRLSAAITYGIIAVLLFFIWKNFLPRSATFAGVVMWIFSAYFLSRLTTIPFLPWSSVYALATQIGAIFALFLWKDKKKPVFLFLTGALVAATFWFRQPVGILLFPTVFFLIVLDAFLLRTQNVLRALTFYCVGAIIFSVPFLLYFLEVGALSSWWHQSILLAFDFGNRLSNRYSFLPTFRALFPSFLHSKENTLWFLLPLSVIAATLWLCVRYLTKRVFTEKEEKIFFLCAVCGVSWAQYFPVSDTSHWFWAASPMIGILFFMTHIFSTKITSALHVKKYSLYLSVCIIFLIFLPTLRDDIHGIKFLSSLHYTRLESPSILQGMYVEKPEQELYDGVTSRMSLYFSLYPQKTYINMTPDALYSAIDPHFAYVHPLYVYWDWATQTLYPDYLSRMHVYVDEHRPLILAREVTDFPGYCTVNLALAHPLQIEIYSRPLRFMVPIEDLFAFTKKTESSYIATSKLDSLLLKSILYNVSSTATASANSNKRILKNTSESVALPTHVKGTKMELYFTSEVFGECTYSFTP